MNAEIFLKKAFIADVLLRHCADGIGNRLAGVAQNSVGQIHSGYALNRDLRLFGKFFCFLVNRHNQRDRAAVSQFFAFAQNVIFDFVERFFVNKRPAEIAVFGDSCAEFVKFENIAVFDENYIFVRIAFDMIFDDILYGEKAFGIRRESARHISGGRFRS